MGMTTDGLSYWEEACTNGFSTAQHPLRILGIFAHPDDETFCAGATIAKYAASGAEVMVMSATRGEAGQIRSAGVATRRTLGRVRQQEFHLACQHLRVQHAVCLDNGDGRLQELELDVLARQVCATIRTFQPDVVMTFGPDGGYGHPDHIAISAATTTACRHSGARSYFPEQLAAGLAPHRPAQLYYSQFPRRPQLLFEQLAHWLVQTAPRFQGTVEFAHALLLLAEAATVLRYSQDHLEVKWCPAGFSLVEQGELVSSLSLILSGAAEVRRESVDGTTHVLARLLPGAFFGEEGLASHTPQQGHVVAVENTTCLVFSPGKPEAFLGRGEGAQLAGIAGTTERDEEQTRNMAIGIDAGPYLQQKLAAIAAYRSQYPIQPDMLPLAIFQQLLGQEYFVPVALVAEVETDIRPLQAA
jgi:LmbE family N-acetylglucosaminyl deacetylase